jgi:tripartite-type tricarboxylate transporter receptor subunit TctC
LLLHPASCGLDLNHDIAITARAVSLEPGEACLGHAPRHGGPSTAGAAIGRLLLAASNDAINATLYDKLNFNFVRDIAAVAGISDGPMVMLANPSLPAKTIPEFIAYAKADPGKINMASGGNGSVNHVAGELFKMMAGVNLVHIPYRGCGPAAVLRLSNAKANR